MDTVFEALTSPDIYNVMIAHPKGGYVVLRGAASVNSPEIGQLVTGDGLQCTLDFLADGSIWATVVNFRRVPAYQGGHFALVYRNIFGLKTYGSYQLVEDT